MSDSLAPRALVLLSGGLDSVAALLWARELWTTEAIAVHYGQRHFAELAAAFNIAHELGVTYELIELGAFSTIAPSSLTGRASGSVVVPMRNAFLISVAAAAAASKGCDRIVVGFNRDDAEAFPDCRPAFVDAMEAAISMSSDRKIRIEAPWLWMSKAEIIGSTLAAEPEAIRHLRRSVSCYHGRRPGCGACLACEKRAEAFALAGIAQ